VLDFRLDEGGVSCRQLDLPGRLVNCQQLQIRQVSCRPFKGVLSVSTEGVAVSSGIV
jgi:hypothetical protein